MLLLPAGMDILSVGAAMTCMDKRKIVTKGAKGIMVGLDEQLN